MSFICYFTEYTLYFGNGDQTWLIWTWHCSPENKECQHSLILIWWSDKGQALVACLSICQSNVQDWEVQRVGLLTKLSGDATISGPWTTFWEVRLWTFGKLIPCQSLCYLIYTIISFNSHDNLILIFFWDSGLTMCPWTCNPPASASCIAEMAAMC
jgi:hypothetical protein